MYAERRHQERVPPPCWPERPPGDSIRVLIEHPDRSASQALALGLRSRGYEPLVCAGPRSTSEAATACPLLHEAGCDAVQGADVIVSALPLASHGLERGIVRRIARDPQAGPLLVAATPAEAEERLGDLTVDAHVAPLTVDNVVRALEGVVTPL